MNLVLQSHIKSVNLGMLELSSRDPSLKQDIKLFYQLAHRMRMTGNAHLREGSTSRLGKSEIVIYQTQEASSRQ
jgi:hypothetical protein